MSTTTDNVAVDTEIKIKGFYVGFSEEFVVGRWGCRGWRVGFVSSSCCRNLTVKFPLCLGSSDEGKL